MHVQIILKQQYSELSEHAIWIVRVEDADDFTEEGYNTLDEALAYIKDVAERPLRPILAWGDTLTETR